MSPWTLKILSVMGTKVIFISANSKNIFELNNSFNKLHFLLENTNAYAEYSIIP
jgi:hypothetical protein